MTEPIVVKNALSKPPNYLYVEDYMAYGERIFIKPDDYVDVTESVTKLVEAEIIEFLKYVKKEYRLELLTAEVIEDEEGMELESVYTAILDYETANELIEEWRNGGRE